MTISLWSAWLNWPWANIRFLKTELSKMLLIIDSLSILFTGILKYFYYYFTLYWLPDSFIVLVTILLYCFIVLVTRLLNYLICHGVLSYCILWLPFWLFLLWLGYHVGNYGYHICIFQLSCQHGTTHINSCHSLVVQLSLDAWRVNINYVNSNSIQIQFNTLTWVKAIQVYSS